ncbi:atp-binding cassette superfamily [Plasmopara halstedii]|uniref:Atp-binding cassette superfamily n=1 Tax=Plasmopara halstedii TaxID=4781 RepID=A0A0P1B1T8_PLAHL|nr:atp-binding cassette superfamily [Plasmopara halstedii]CEG47790.1 atp-binding cassette superfamily [Plasmopara halstedii]|eukprot:XP_024584159.1 atp-binding cassette superfamily [Plasmopara halstedii]
MDRERDSRTIDTTLNPVLSKHLSATDEAYFYHEAFQELSQTKRIRSLRCRLNQNTSNPLRRSWAMQSDSRPNARQLLPTSNQNALTSDEMETTAVLGASMRSEFERSRVPISQRGLVSPGTSFENLETVKGPAPNAFSSSDMPSKPKVALFDSVSQLSTEGFRQRAALQTCSISWQHISYFIQPKENIFSRFRKKNSKRVSGPSGLEAQFERQQPRKILNSVWGRSGPGELTAILGPSGAGKTTLLDMLADRVPSGGSGVHLEGLVEVNGQPRDLRTFHSIMNYVSEEMAFLGAFTVLETLQIGAGLSLPGHMPPVQREARVQDVIDAMGLRSCSNARVGDIFHKGISSGQRKRLGIALELLSDPALLLLDEPTSGLDSSSARGVMQYIERLCQEGGKNVVCTIHQPSSSIYGMLTNLIILSSGELVYSGPTNAAIAHFFSMGYVCPMYTNPAEYFVHLVNTNFHDGLKLEPFIRALKESAEPQRLRADVVRDRSRRDQLMNPELLKAMRPWPLDQAIVLVKRNLTNNWRHPGVFWLRVMMYVLLSLMVGTMYLSSNREITNMSMVSLLFYVQAFLVFMSVAALPALLEHRAVMEREMRSYALSLTGYTMSNLLASLPGILLISVLASTIVVFLARVYSLPTFLLNLTLSLIAAESLMHLLGAAVPHYIMGIALGAGLFGMFMLCEGFMVPFDDMPAYWKWGYYIAFHTYSFESFMYEHFSAVNTEEAWDLLKRYGMDQVDVVKNMIILAAYSVVLQILVIGVLYLRFNRHRRR